MRQARDLDKKLQQRDEPSSPNFHGGAKRVRQIIGRNYYRALGRAAALMPGGAIGVLRGLTAQYSLTPEQLLLGYAQGLFPMGRKDQVSWHCPDPRCVIRLKDLHVPRRDERYLRKEIFELSIDQDPVGVLRMCADREYTWLTPRLQRAYEGLHKLSAMHSVEAWRRGRLVGGLFGVATGATFSVDSMFSIENNSSKLAFAYLCQRLAERGFMLVDCQYQKEHVQRFGAIEISRKEFREHLARGMVNPPLFHPLTTQGSRFNS